MGNLGKVYVAGHQGMVGRAICRRLACAGECSLITRTRAELDLTEQAAVGAFLRRTPRCGDLGSGEAAYTSQ